MSTIKRLIVALAGVVAMALGVQADMSGPDIGCHFGKERFRSEYINTV